MKSKEEIMSDLRSIRTLFSKKISIPLFIGIVVASTLLFLTPFLLLSCKHSTLGNKHLFGKLSPQFNNNFNRNSAIQVKTKNGGIIKTDQSKGTVSGFTKFASKDEFDEYLSNASQNSLGGYATSSLGRGDMMKSVPMPTTVMEDSTWKAGYENASESAQRVSDTNVQVLGIDEPDILKTDGKNLYYSQQNSGYYPEPIIFDERLEEMPVSGVSRRIPSPSVRNIPETQIISAFPVSTMEKKGSIEKTGTLLFENNVLVVFENQNVYGYDVSDPSNPKEIWSVKLDNQNQIDQARLFNGKVYLITKSYTSRGTPCPMPLLTSGSEKISVRCTDIYHPIAPVSVGSTYTVSSINPENGKVSREISFLGSFDSTVYMSENALYVAYSYSGDSIEFFLGFFKENPNIIPQRITDRLTKLNGYDLSQEAKMTELQTILQDMESSLTSDEKLTMENEMRNRMETYMTKHKRDLSKTDIVKMNVRTFAIEAIGTIPGTLLNQFSLDEYKGNLRTATTIGGGVWSSGNDNENDVYVLDKDMNITGSVLGLGKEERIYSVRFLEDKGYVVTFRQTDPFYVLDLSNPKNPEVKGELKIPGYSSYLHPIASERILGIGKEGSSVKISLFDVSDPSNPAEVSKYTLDEYWSDALETHHAFLTDKKYEIFFLPGSKGGYVFSYENDTLALKKAVSDIQVKRAAFINDYLYIVGEKNISVLNEKNWEKVKELEL